MLSIHIGQFGNQVGLEFWAQLLCIPETEPNTRLSPDQRNSIASWLEVRNSFLHEDGTARIVAVDSEPRVIANAYTLQHNACADIYSEPRGSSVFSEISGLTHVSQHSRFSCDANLHSLTSPTFDDYKAQKRQKTKRSQPQKALPSTNSFQYMQNGCGNNWALGYYGEDHVQHPLLTSAQNAVKYHVDKMHGEVEGILQFHSLAGGTGSGLGSRLAVELRKQQGPSVILMSICGSPLKIGEVVQQHYNSVCTIAALYDSVDAVWMCPTEDAMHISKHCISAAATLAQKYNSSQISTFSSFGSINSYLCSTLIDFLAPQACVSTGEISKSKHVIPSLVQQYVTNIYDSIEKDLDFIPYHDRTLTFYPRTSTQLRQRILSLAIGPLKFIDIWACQSAQDLDKTMNKIPNRQVELAAKCIFTTLDSPYNVSPLFERQHPIVDYNKRHVTSSNLHSFSSALKLTQLPLRTLQSKKEGVNWATRTLVIFNSTKQTQNLQFHMDRMQMLQHANAYTHWFVKHGCSVGELSNMQQQCQHISQEYNRFTK